MDTIRVLCFVGFSTDWLYPCRAGLRHWRWRNHTIVPVPVNKPWRIPVNRSLTIRIWRNKQNKHTIPCAYYMGYPTFSSFECNAALNLAPGPCFNINVVFSHIGIIFIMEMPVQVRWQFYSETSPTTLLGCKTLASLTYATLCDKSYGIRPLVSTNT